MSWKLFLFPLATLKPIQDKVEISIYNSFHETSHLTLSEMETVIIFKFFFIGKFYKAICPAVSTIST